MRLVLNIVAGTTRAPHGYPFILILLFLVLVLMSNPGSTWLILILILVLMSPMKTHEFLILLLSSLCCHTAKVWSSRQSAPSGCIDCCPQASLPPFEMIIMFLLGPKSPASLGRHHSLDQALSAGNDREEFLLYISPKTYCHAPTTPGVPSARLCQKLAHGAKVHTLGCSSYICRLRDA